MTTQIEPAVVAASDPPVDQRVLDVQEWLNEYYGPAAGAQWIAVPETGRTGWSTMYGLTRALQHELGIATLSNNFGDGTLAALTTQFPTINSATTSSNPAKVSRIVKIIQGGLYCKGYNPAGLDGNFGPGCAAAVNSMKTDMGFTTTSAGTVTPKIFKGLLTMDAYVLLPGGTTAARSVQQWLNNTYLGRKNFFVMPCDGLYSRNTQKALVYALQYEIGMTDATANGNFGPGTRDGVRDHGTFNKGAQDPGASHWVRLFHGALIFNKYQVPFDSTFSASDSAVVESFQDFCKLDVNGNADYRTWCSLLVSNGDPTRLGTACDTRVQITPTFGSILSNLGYETVGRYLTNARVASPLEKEIKPGELNAIFNAGLSVFPIYQEVGSSVGNFSYTAGLEAGYRADRAARQHGVPAGTTIYFAVDFDPTDDQIATAVLPHMRGVDTALARRGGRFKAGIYGTRNVCQTVTDAGLATYSFVAGMSTGFSGNLGYTLPTNWAFDQIYEYTVTTGLPLDKNIKSGRDTGFSTVDLSPSIPDANADLFEFLLWLEVRAQRYIEESGRDYHTPAELVCQFMREPEYNGLTWDQLVGALDVPWISETKAALASLGMSHVGSYLDATQQGASEPRTFTCPHLFVAIESYLRRGYPVQSDHVDADEAATWAGDLLSVMNGYRRSQNAGYAESFTAYASKSVGTWFRPDGTWNYFMFDDFCQDADAYNIAREYTENAPSSFAELVIRHLNNGGPSTSKNRFETFLEDRFGSYANASYAARQAFDAVPVPATPAFLAYRTILLGALTPPTTVGSFTAAEREAVGIAFADRLQTLS